MQRIEGPAAIDATLSTLSSTAFKLEQRNTSAEETLSDIRKTLKRWDDMKERFDEALKSACYRIAESMEEPPPAVYGPPSGVIAHGWVAPASLPDPRQVVRCEEVARPKMGAEIAAHEYLDQPEALASKVRILADMIRRSRYTVAYTGAGISTAAGIADYASRAGRRSYVLPRKIVGGSPFDAGDAMLAEPTKAHRALVAMHHHGVLHAWVQQNHDGLPQKAGLPQDAINEIHGGWFDPSNPVVPMDGRLRSDLVKKLRNTTACADLVIAMGTSLSGVAADSIVSAVARRAKREERKAGDVLTGKPLPAIDESGKSEKACDDSASRALGSVIINAQQTRLDTLASLRIFAKLDEVLHMLTKELQVPVPPPSPLASLAHEMSGDVWKGLPYDAQGALLTDRSGSQDTVDVNLRKGQAVELTDGNEPLALVGTKGVVDGKTPQGHYRLRFSDGKMRVLGRWMMEAAVEGRIPQLPVMNARS